MKNSAMGILILMLAMSVFAASPAGGSGFETTDVMDYSVGDCIIDLVTGDETGEINFGFDRAGDCHFIRATNSYPEGDGTGWIGIYIDGTLYKSGSTLPTPDEIIAGDYTARIRWFNFHGVDIEIVTRLLIGDESGTVNHMLHWTTEITPVDGSSHEIGAMLFMDMNIGGEDSPFITTPSFPVTTASFFTDATMPEVWTAWESSAMPSPDDRYIFGVVQSYRTVEPDGLWFGNRPDGTDNGWDVSDWTADTGDDITDIAMMSMWAESEIFDGESAYFATIFGTPEYYSNPIDFTHVPPEPDAGCGEVELVGFDYTAENLDEMPVFDFYIQIEVPPGVTLTDSDSTGLAVFTSGATVDGSFNAEVDRSLYGTTIDYIITYHFDDTTDGHHHFFMEENSVDIPDPGEIPYCEIITVEDGCPEGYTCMEAAEHWFVGPEYLWTPEGLFDDPTEMDQTFAVSDPVWVYLTVTDSMGCTWTDSALAGISFDPLVADAGADRTIWFSESTDLGGDPSASGGVPPYTFAWTPEEDLSSPTAENPTATPDSTSEYVLTVTDGIGFTASDTVVVTVDYFDDLTVDAGPNRTIWFGESVLLGGDPTVVGGVTPYTITWSPATDLSSTTAENPIASPDSTREYVVTVEDALGNTASDTVLITVEYYDPLVAEAGADRTIWFGESTDLGGDPTANGGVPPYTIAWTPATGLSSTTATNPTATPDATQEYIVTVEDALGNTASDTVVVTVDYFDDLEADAGPDRTIWFGESTTIGGDPTAMGGVPPYTITWTPATGLSSTTAENPTASPDDTQEYIVTVEDALGNTASDTVIVNVNFFDELTVFAGDDREIWIGESTTLGGEPTVMGGVAPYSITWSPAAGLSDYRAENPNASPTTTTSYIVTVEDGLGNTDADTVLVTVNVYGDLVADAGDDLEIWAGESVTIGGSPTASGGVAPYTFTWYPSTGLSDYRAENPTASPTTTTSYIVTVEDELGNTDSDTVVVTVNTYDPLVADAGADREIWIGESTNLGGRPTVTGGVAPYTILWSPAIGLSSTTAENPTASPELTVEYVVTVEDAIGNTDSDTVLVTVNVYEPLFVDAGEDQSIYLGDEVEIGGHPAIIGGVPPYTIMWIPEIGLSSPFSENPMASPEVSTPYILQVEDALGNMGMDDVIVEVMSTPLVAHAGDDHYICIGNTVMLGGSPAASGGVPPYTYSWEPPLALDNPASSNPSATPLSETTYMLMVSDSRGVVSEDEVTVHISCLTADAGEDISICPDGDVTIGGSPTASGGLAPYNILWSPSTGLSSATAANPTVTGAVDRDYIVTITDNAGNLDQDTVRVTVADPYPRLYCNFERDPVDIVFAMDTSGSMSSTIAGVRSNIENFALELEAQEMDFRLGASTFGDRPVGMWDFDPSSPGFQMTDNVDEFLAQLSTTGASGGGDGPECFLDAIGNPINEYEWRPDAIHVVITFTDNSYHYRGDGTTFSDYLDSELYSLVMSTGTIVFVSARDSWWMGDAFEFYTMLAEDSGGEIYDLGSTDWGALFSDVVERIASVNDLVVTATNCSPSTCTIHGEFMSEDPEHLDVESENPLHISVATGQTAEFAWEFTGGLIPDEVCYSVRIWGCEFEDTLYGCVTEDGCEYLVADAGGDRYIDFGDDVTLGGDPSASGGNPPYTYSWEPPDYLDDPTSPNPVCTAPVTTRYTLWVEDETGAEAHDIATVFVEMPELIVDAGEDMEIGEGDSVGIGGSPTASGGVPPYTYVWSPAGFVDSPSSANPIASPPVTTAFIVQVIDDGGNTGRDTVVISVVEDPELLAHAGEDREIDFGGSTTLGGTPSATGGRPPYTYWWDPAEYVDDPMASNPVATPAMSGEFLLTVMDDGGHIATDIVRVTLRSSDDLAAHAGADFFVEPYERFTLGDFPAATGGTPPYTYLWSPADPLIVPAYYANPEAVITEPTYFVLQVSDAVGAFDWDTVYVSFSPDFIVDGGGDRYITLGDTVRLGGDPTARGGVPPYTYIWEGHDTERMSATDIANPLAWPVDPVNYYELYAHDSEGHWGGDTIVVYVSPAEDLEAHAGEDFSVTSGEMFSLGDTPAATGGMPPYEYEWEPTGPIIGDSDVEHPNARITGRTTFILHVYDDWGDSAFDYVTVEVLADLVAHAGADRYIEEGDTVTIGGFPAATGGTPPYTYSWDWTTYLSDPTAANPDAWPITTIQYMLTVEDAAGRWDTDTMMVYVEPVEELMADAGEEQWICRGDAAVLGGYPPVTGGTPPYTFTWTPEDGLSDPTDFHPSAIPFFTTLYMLTVEDSRGRTASDVVVVNVDCPVADAGEDVYICPGMDITIGGDPAAFGGVPPYEYTWSPSVGLSDMHAANPVASPDYNLSYVLQVTDAMGNMAWDTVQANISLEHARLNCFFGMQMLDIVFVLDTTGSMGGEIADVRSNLMDFAAYLEESEMDYRLGGVTFGDGENIWDFDPGTPGNQMTASAEFMQAKLSTTGVGGGGDGPETSLDAMAMAIDDYEWREDAMHVIFMITDITYHFRGDGTDFSEWTDVELFDHVMGSGTTVYIAGGSTWSSDIPFYDTLAYYSGGTSYSLSGDDWTVAFDDIVDDMYADNDITVELTNCSPSICTYRGEFISDDDDLLDVVSTNPYLTEPVEPGRPVALPWEVDYHGTGDTVCYTIIVEGCGEIDTFSGCISTAGCLNLKADAGPDLYVDYGDSVIIGGEPAASGGAPPYSYIWETGLYLDNPNLANPMCVPEETRRYVLHVIDHDGTEAFDDMTVYVTDPLSLIVDAGRDTTIPRGSSVTIGGSPTVSGGTPPYSYNWLPATGLTATDVANPVATVYATTKYRVYVEDAMGRTGMDSVTVTVEDLPDLIVDAGEDKYIILGDAVEIGGDPTAGGGLSPYEYRWSPGAYIDDIYISNPTVNPVSTTTYRVTAEDMTGATGSDEVTVFVSVPEPLTAHAGPDRGIEAGESTVLGDTPAATGGTPPYSFSWSPTDGLDNPNIANPSITPMSTRTFILTVTDDAGGFDTDTVIVRLPETTPLRAFAGPDMEMDLGESIYIGTTPAAAGGYPPYSYSWSPSDDLSGPHSDTPRSSAEVTTTYTLTVSDITGATATDEMILTVHDMFELVADAGPDKYLPLGGAARIGGSPTASGGELPYSFLWTPATGLSFDTNPNPTAAPAVTTTYTITVEDNDGTIATDEMTVYIEEEPPEFSVDAGPDRTIDLGGSTVIGGSPTVTGGVDPVTIEWIGPYLHDPHTANPEASPEVTTTYIVVAEDGIGRTETDTMIVTVTDEPDPLWADAGPDRTIMLGFETELGGYPAAGGGESPYTYSWMPHPELGDVFSPNPLAWPSSSMYFYLTVTDDAGHTARDSVYVTVEEELPELIVDAGPDRWIAFGATISIGGTPTVTGGIYPLDIEWTGLDITDPSVENPLVSPTRTSDYIVTVTDGEGRTGTDTMTVYVTDEPLWAEAGEDRVIFRGDTTIIGGYPAAGGGNPPYTYLWSEYHVDDYELPNPEVWPDHSNIYYLRVEDAVGATAWDSVWVLVTDEMPEFSVDAGPDITITEGDSAIIGGSPTVNGAFRSYTVEWTGTPIDDDSADNPTVWPLTTRTYIVTASDFAGRTDTDTMIVFVDPMPLWADAGPDKYISFGDTTEIGGHPAAGGGTPPYTYMWLPSPEMSEYDVPNPLAWPTVSSEYVLTVMDDAGAFAEDLVWVYVDEEPEEFTVFAGEDRTISLGDTTILGGEPTGLGGTPPYMFIWEPIYNISDPSSANPGAWPAEDTYYILTGIDSEMHSDVDTVLVTVISTGDDFVRVSETVPATDYIYLSVVETFQRWRVASEVGAEIQLLSISVSYNGVDYWLEPGDPYLSYAIGFVSFMNPEPASIESGDTILYTLETCADVLGNPLYEAEINDIWIIYDLEPPELTGVYPSDGATVPPGAITIAGMTEDALSGVQGDETFMTVNGERFDSSDPGFYATDEGFTLEYIAGDDITELEVCVFTADRATPTPNEGEECWTINVSEEAPGSGPRVASYSPEVGLPVSCDPVQISFTLIDTSGIDLETVRFGISIDGSIDTLWPSLYSPSVMVQYVDYGIEVFYTTPPATFDDGRIGVVVDAAEDFHGNPLEERVSWEFEYDVAAPVLSMLFPTPGGGAETAPDSIGLNMFDSYAGLDMTSFLMTVEGASFDIDHPAISYDAATGDVAFDPALSGVSLPDSGIMTVSVIVEDLTGACEPNLAETTWVFYIGMAVEEMPGLPSAFALLGNRPNPFNSSTDILFSTDGGNVQIDVYTVTGERIRRVEMGHLTAGIWAYTFDASDLPTGIYHYAITDGSERLTGRMLLVK